MEENSILVVHDERELPSNIEKELAAEGFKLIAVQSRARDWSIEMGRVRCV